MSLKWASNKHLLLSAVFVCWTRRAMGFSPLLFQRTLQHTSVHRFSRPLYAMDEQHRQEEYRKRGYTWPVQNFVPNTPGWRQLMERRMSQVWSIADYQPRYNGWLSIITSAVVSPNFTETGFQLTKAPQALVEELKESLHSGLRENRTRLELGNEIITNGEAAALPPLFIDQEELNAKVLKELQPIHEEFAGVDLVGAKTYGLRLYRNESTLLMHTDKLNTHIIASILHIDHSPDSDPWPIVIEDYYGNTHEVVMQSGDLLLYESSKLYHGRPKPFRGSWYCSIFSHYYPVDWDTENTHLEAHYAVPPIWFEDAPQVDAVLPRVEVVGTALRELDCKHGWSGLEASIKHYPPVDS